MRRCWCIQFWSYTSLNPSKFGIGLFFLFFCYPIILRREWFKYNSSSKPLLKRTSPLEISAWRVIAALRLSCQLVCEPYFQLQKRGRMVGLSFQGCSGVTSKKSSLFGASITSWVLYSFKAMIFSAKSWIVNRT